MGYESNKRNRGVFSKSDIGYAMRSEKHPLKRKERVAVYGGIGAGLGAGAGAYAAHNALTTPSINSPYPEKGQPRTWWGDQHGYKVRPDGINSPWSSLKHKVKVKSWERRKGKATQYTDKERSRYEKVRNLEEGATSEGDKH